MLFYIFYNYNNYICNEIGSKSKYNDNNIYIGHIKQLLKDFNLPNCRVYKEGIQVADGLCYLDDNKIYLCENGKLNEVRDYKEGEYIPNLTSNLKVSNLIYDSYTHKYLGRYLRFLKDYYKVDLMSMYNCFSYDSLNYKVSIGKFQSDDGYVVYSIPVRFFEEYTIGINCATDIELLATFVGKDGLLNVGNKADVESATYCKKTNCFLNQPFVFDSLKNIEVSQDCLRKESYLRLLIKVPLSCNSSIIVVEGNYLDCFKVRYTDLSLPSVIITKEMLKDSSYVMNYKSKLQLFSSENSKDNNLLADRLVEYLSRNAIDPTSEYYDIKKVQKLLIQADLLDSAMYGTWDEGIRKVIYKYISNLGLNSKYYDMISYVDKDVETNFANLVVGGLI